MQKPLYVLVQALIYDDGAGQGSEPTAPKAKNLPRNVSEEFMGKTFSELLQKMADPNTDDYHTVPYSTEDMEIANYLNNLLADANSNPKAMHLYGVPNQAGAQKIQLKLHEKVSKYSGQIVSIEQGDEETGDFRKMHLIVAPAIPGGIDAIVEAYGK